MTATDLCQPSDVSTALLRPLTATEITYVPSLIVNASALLRNAAPSIDDRMARFTPNGTDPTSIDPVVVATVVAGVVKRYMTNPQGIASQSAGPFSVAYALRTEKGARGVLQVTDEDLRTLFPNRKRMRAGTIRTRPGLAPRPVGRYGPIPDPISAVSAVIEWSSDVPLVGAEIVEFLPDPAS